MSIGQYIKRAVLGENEPTRLVRVRHQGETFSNVLGPYGISPESKSALQPARQYNGLQVTQDVIIPNFVGEANLQPVNKDNLL